MDEPGTAADVRPVEVKFLSFRSGRFNNAQEKLILSFFFKNYVICYFYVLERHRSDIKHIKYK